MVLRGWLVYGDTTHPKSVSTVPVFPASPKVEGEASQLPKVLISNPSLALFMAGTVKAQALDSTSCVATELCCEVLSRLLWDGT